MKKSYSILRLKQLTWRNIFLKFKPNLKAKLYQYAIPLLCDDYYRLTNFMAYN